MFPLVLLLTQVCSASQSSLTSSTFSYSSYYTHSGYVSFERTNGYLIDLNFQSVYMITFNLEVSQGDANLYVYTLVNNMPVEWKALAVGSDYLAITDKDYGLNKEGLGPQRRFEVYVMGASTQLSQYTLTVTAYGTSDWKVASEESINKHVAARKKSALFTMKKYEGELPEHMKAVETGSGWMGVVGGVVLLGVGVVVWRKWGGRQGKTEKLAYRLI